MANRVDQWAHRTFAVKHESLRIDRRPASTGFERHALVAPVPDKAIKALVIPDAIEDRFVDRRANVDKH